MYTTHGYWHASLCMWGLKGCVSLLSWLFLLTSYAIGVFRVVLQAIFFVVYMASAAGAVSFSLAELPWYTYVLGLAWILAIVPLNEGAKAVDARRYARLQKRSRLLFGTKLGMHSPV